MENKRAIGVRQDHVTSPTPDNPIDKSHAVPISSRSADSYYIQSPTNAIQSISKESLMSKDYMVADNIRTSNREGSEEEDPFEEDDESSIDTDITQFHIPSATESDNNDDADDDHDDDHDDNDDNNDNINDDDNNDDDDDDNEALLRQSNNDTKKKSDQHVEGRISYYSYGDFEPRNSGLIEVKVGLHTPSKTSSRYGSMTDVSRSSFLAALER